MSASKVENGKLESLDCIIQRLVVNTPKIPFKVSKNIMAFIFQIKFKYGLDEN